MQISNSYASFYASSLTQGSTTKSQQAQPTASGSSIDPTSSASDTAEQTFLNYMKETPAQRMEDAWLASHHLTRKDLDAMSPEKRQAIEKQMAEDIKHQIKQATDKKSAASTNILV